MTPAEAGGTIQYSTNGGVSWTGSFTAVEGANNVEVRQVDAAGNNGAAALFSFTLDTTAPAEALAITAIATDTGTVGDFITSDTTLIVSGTNGALAAGDKIQVSSDGGVTWHDVVQNTATSWSYDDTATTHATSFTYQARVIDIASNVGATASQPVTIDTTAPVNTVPAGPLTVNEDTALTFTNGSAISVHDVNGNLASTQLSVQHGKLTVSLAGGAQISAGTNGSGALTLSGAEAQINAVLATLTYQGGSNFNGSDTLTVTSTDSAAGIDIDSVSINVTALNDPPVNTVPGTQTVSSGTPRYFNTANGNAISISDVDVNETAAPNNIAQVNLTVAQGTLTLTALDGISITGGANNSSNITLQGTLAAINNALASLSFEGTASTTLTVTTNDLGHTGAGSAVPVQSNIQINVTPADPHLWGTFTYPPQPTAGVHIFNPGLAPNPANGFVALGFSSTPNYDPIQNPGGPYPLTINVTAFDPFFLPELNVLPVETVNTTLPARQSFDAPNIANGSSINGEGLAFFVTNTNGHNVINESIIGGSNSGNSISATPPIVLKDVGTDTIFNLRSSVRQDSSISGTPVLTTYQVSWDQFNASAHTYSVNFKLFNANNTQVAEVDNALSLPNVQTITTAPAWAFGGGGGAYVLAYGSTVSNHDVLNFQGYTTAGAPTQIISAGATSFQIAPDLSHYATGAVNHITQIQVPTLGAAPGGPSNALAFGGFSQATGFSYATAWSETVVDSTGTHDQVEFVIYDPGVINGHTAHIVSRSTFQIADGNPQNVRLGSFGDLAVLAYGDNTNTQLVEFNSSGVQLASITDPTTQAFGQFASLGDGRFAIGYDNVIDGNQTSQYDFKIFDLRTSAINVNDASLTDGKDKYVAGTCFGGDLFVGENLASNFYYYVGNNGAAGPTNSFTGGTFDWNTAIFPDSRLNYTISLPQADGSVIVTNIDPQHAHAGSLTLQGVSPVAGVNVPSVQVLAFGPSKDPAMLNGVLEASAGTLYLVASTYSIGSNPPTSLSNTVLIDSGATLEFNMPFSGRAYFSDTGGTLRLDPQAQNTTSNPNAFTGLIILSARQTGAGAFDYLDFPNQTVSSAQLNGTTLTVVTGTGTQVYNNVIGQLGATPGTSIPISFVPDGAGGTKLAFTPVGSLWGSFTYPAQPVNGEHLQSAGAVSVNTANNIVATAFGSIDGYSTSNPSGPYVLGRNILPMDPFFLPINTGDQIYAASTVTLPARSQFFVPSVLTPQGVQAEGFATYVTQDSNNHSVINQELITGFAPGTPLAIGSPTQIGDPNTNTATPIYNLQVNGRQDFTSGTLSYLKSESIAWDQFNGSSYNIDFQIQNFNADGTTAVPSPVVTVPAIASGANLNALPAWMFRPGGGAYTLALAQSDSSVDPSLNLTIPHNSVHFTVYDTSGTPTGVNFTIQPDLNDFAHDGSATNHIIQNVIPTLNSFPGNPALSLQFVQLTAANQNAWVIAWNETVTDLLGTHDQVEFDVFVGGGPGVIFHRVFDIPGNDPQNVRVVSYSDPNVPGKDYAVLYYGDSNFTNLIEFSAVTTGGVTQINPVAVVADPTTVAASSVQALGDGRIEVGYDNVLDANQTSQDTFKVFDLRTTGVNIDDHSLSDGHAKYIAGTQFNDSFTGENNVNNAYYFVGSPTAGSPPSDVFHGGTGTSWNTAIFADDRANYSVIFDPVSSKFVINNIDPQHLHAGTLTVDQNVQALAFNPTHDPTLQADGSLEASGDTLVILQPVSNPATIDSGATLEIYAANSAEQVTFNATTGTLRLDQSVNYTGTISGFSTQDGTLANSDKIDLRDINSATAQVTGYTNGVLTVTDGTNTANLHFSGSYVQSNFKLAPDGQNGTFVYDPPSSPDTSTQSANAVSDSAKAVTQMFDVAVPSAHPDVTQSADTQSVSVTFGAPNTDTFVFRPGFGANTIVSAKSTDTIELDRFSSITSADQLQTYLNEAQNNQPQNIFQAANGGHDTVINLGNNDVITLTNVHLTDLHASNFFIHT